MMPIQEALRNWHLTMITTQTLATIVRKDMERLNPLLQGLVFTAFQNPLLRIAAIDGVPCIAHTLPLGISIRGDDNPLENASSTGDFRARMASGSATILIEQNMGPRYKDEIERSLDKACNDAGNAMVRSGDFIGKRGQEFSTLLRMTMSSHGSAFEWKTVTAHELSKFNNLAIIDHKTELWHDTPTFDLILSSK